MSRLVAATRFNSCPNSPARTGTKPAQVCRGNPPVSGSGLLRTLPITVFVVASALALAIPRAAAAQTGANVLVVINNDPLALNNLAYALAVYRNNPAEALPIAQRATVVAREDPALLGGASIANYYSLGTYRREPLVPYSLDTLAVQHLLGRHTEAATTIREALAADGGFATDLRWHAAIIYAAVDDMHQTSAELSAAVTADPTLVNRAEIQKLRQQLAARKF